uniref:MBD domain-containing protein n=1 Tax=Strigamia maritima TaxID=126957 RepID=T1INS7_STRMM
MPRLVPRMRPECFAISGDHNRVAYRRISYMRCRKWMSECGQTDQERPEPTVTAVHPVRGADPPRSPIQTSSRTALSGPVSHLVQKRLHKREYQQTRPGQIAVITGVPHLVGWQREEVQRQSGATKGNWDVYYYGPDGGGPLRSNLEVMDYCNAVGIDACDKSYFKWSHQPSQIWTVLLIRHWRMKSVRSSLRVL